jgi:penicillin-binding protein 2B
MNSESISHERLKRATILLVGILLVFAILLGRIFWIQTVDFDKYLSKVIDQMTTQSAVSAERGTIYDKNGNVLATNITTYRIFISPSSILSHQQKADNNGEHINYAEDISSGLSKILDVDYDTVYKQTTYTKSQPKPYKVVIPSISKVPPPKKINPFHGMILTKKANWL